MKCCLCEDLGKIESLHAHSPCVTVKMKVVPLSV